MGFTGIVITPTFNCFSGAHLLPGSTRGWMMCLLERHTKISAEVQEI